MILYFNYDLVWLMVGCTRGKGGRDNQGFCPSANDILCAELTFWHLRVTLSNLWTEQVNKTLSSAPQDEEKSVRQRRKLASDSNTSEVSDC